MVQELYPGRVKNGGGFTVAGFAKTSKSTMLFSRPDVVGQLEVGFYSFGPGGLFVYQAGQFKTPIFNFRVLTTKFLANAIWIDRNFSFSMIHKRIGEITYITGPEAREFGGEVYQGIISLNANGNWSSEGLNLNIHGELGDNSALLDKPTHEKFKQSFYQISLNIPWENLRFLFYDEINFLLSNYGRYGPNLE